MRTSKVITISVPPKFEHEIQKHAEYEHRTVSEYVREAVHHYMAQQEFESASRRVSRRLKKKGLKPADVERVLDELSRGRLAQECAKLNPKAEQAMANEGLSSEVKNWPKY